MPHRYRCNQCRTTWPEGPRGQAEGDRDRHRRRTHDGGAPDAGDAIDWRPVTPPSERVNWGAVIKFVAFFALLVIANKLWPYIAPHVGSR
ncbi:hypothetical protein [Streptomyces triticirhizae]|uniref:Uncharacterized protein n=1 Tax=Streptomyces triticirhizae TaxID=2483353 RepID=A0A3M2M4E4_9ACTN|nr:hypothetical protein [Streptomyces triticirhizae]RMI44421.1 hypothetical protein EBN88_05320 [Streptomyces triticirhizae]